MMLLKKTVLEYNVSNKENMAVQFNMHMPSFNPDMGVGLNAAPTWKLRAAFKIPRHKAGRLKILAAFGRKHVLLKGILYINLSEKRAMIAGGRISSN